jgi:hypothetical protein
MGELQVRWAEVRPRHGVAGAWIAAVLHLVSLAIACLATNPGDSMPAILGTVTGMAIAFGWFCACWRLDAAETSWTTAEPLPPGPRAPRPTSTVGLRAAWRGGRRPALAWLVGAAAVLTGLRGLEGFTAWLVLAMFLAPVAILFGWLFWLLLVLPLRYFVHGVRRLRRPADGAPPVGIAMVGTSLLLWCVLPLVACLMLSGAASSRYDVWPTLLGAREADAGAEPLLWAARGLAALIVTIAVAGMWWLRREQRRLQEDRGGIVRL